MFHTKLFYKSYINFKIDSFEVVFININEPTLIIKAKTPQQTQRNEQPSIYA